MIYAMLIGLFLVTVFNMVCVAFLFGRTADFPSEEQEQEMREEREEQKKRTEKLNEIFDYDPYQR